MWGRSCRSFEVSGEILKKQHAWNWQLFHKTYSFSVELIGYIVYDITVNLITFKCLLITWINSYHAFCCNFIYYHSQYWPPVHNFSQLFNQFWSFMIRYLYMNLLHIQWNTFSIQKTTFTSHFQKLPFSENWQLHNFLFCFQDFHLYCFYRVSC